MREDPVRLAHVLLDHGHLPVAGQQLASVQHGDRVDVDVHHPGVRRGRLGDLVHVADGRDAGADVDELANAGLGQLPNHTLEERAVGAAAVGDVRDRRDDGFGGLAIGGEVVRAAEVVVVHAGRTRLLDVDAGRGPGRTLHGLHCAVFSSGAGSVLTIGRL